MDKEVLIVSLLTGTLAATIITSIKEVILWILNRRANEEDKSDDLVKKVNSQEESINKILTILENLEKKVDASCKSDKVLLQDRIKVLILKYISEEQVSFEDRKLVHEMWNIYHFGLNGNGDLNDLMEIFDQLPLKQ